MTLRLLSQYLASWPHGFIFSLVFMTDLPVALLPLPCLETEVREPCTFLFWCCMCELRLARTITISVRAFLLLVSGAFSENEIAEPCTCTISVFVSVS